MNYIEIAQQIANYHNILSDIPVRGEDAIRMAEVLVSMRQLASTLAQEPDKEASDEKEV